MKEKIYKKTIAKKEIYPRLRVLNFFHLFLNMEVERISKDIIELQKEAEQFLYILEEEKKELIKKILLAEEEASSEYMQSKYITNK